MAPGILLWSNHPSTMLTEQAGQHFSLLLTHQTGIQCCCNTVLLQRQLCQTRKRPQDLFPQAGWAEAVKEVPLFQGCPSDLPLLLWVEVRDQKVLEIPERLQAAHCKPQTLEGDLCGIYYEYFFLGTF